MQIQPTSLTRYILTPEEETSGMILTASNKATIQNYIADKTEERFNLNIDTANPLAFVQAEAEIKGAVGALKYLLQCSDEAEAANLKLAIQTAATPQN